MNLGRLIALPEFNRRQQIHEQPGLVSFLDLLCSSDHSVPLGFLIITPAAAVVHHGQFVHNTAMIGIHRRKGMRSLRRWWLKRVAQKIQRYKNNQMMVGKQRPAFNYIICSCIELVRASKFLTKRTREKKRVKYALGSFWMIGLALFPLSFFSISWLASNAHLMLIYYLECCLNQFFQSFLDRFN